MMIELVFVWCVHILVELAQLLGISYEAINVWIFVIIWPVLTLAMSILLIIQRTQIRRLKTKCRGNTQGAAI